MAERLTMRTVVIVTALIASSIFYYLPAKAEGPNTVYGVVSSGGNPLENVFISINGINNTTTDASGHYSIELDPAVTSINLTASMDGYLPYSFSLPVANLSSGIEHNIELTPYTSVIKGYIKDAGQNNINNVQVVLYKNGLERASTTTTDGLYSFSFTAEAGVYSLYALKDGYYTAQSSITIEYGQTVWHNITLAGYSYTPVNLSGYVMDNNMDPLSGTMVTVFDVIKEEEVFVSFTRMSGFFNFSLYPGCFELRVSKNGYYTYLNSSIIVTGPDNPIYYPPTSPIVLSPLPSTRVNLTGLVTDSAMPLKWASISIKTTGSGQYYSTWVQTDSRGYYGISLVPGEYKITAIKADYFPHEATLNITSDTIHNISLSWINKNITFSGYVIDSQSRAIAGSRLEIYDPVTGFYTSVATVDGNFNTKLYASTYIILITAPNNMSKIEVWALSENSTGNFITLAPKVPDTVLTSLNFTDWNNVIISRKITYSGTFADMAFKIKRKSGSTSLNLTPSEIEEVLNKMEAIGPYDLLDTSTLFKMDGIVYTYNKPDGYSVTPETVLPDVRIDSVVPFTLYYNATYTSASAVPTTLPHYLNLTMMFNTAGTNYVYSVNLPEGVEKTSLVSSIPPTPAVSGYRPFTITSMVNTQAPKEYSILTIEIKNNTPPRAVATFETKVQWNVSVSFSGSSSWDDVEQNNLNYLWDFGDGSDPVTSMIVFHTYNETVNEANGWVNGLKNFTVNLTVTDSGGLSASDVKNITVDALPPEVKVNATYVHQINESAYDNVSVSAGGSLSIKQNERVILNCSESSDNSGQITFYTWTVYHVDRDQSITLSGNVTEYSFPYMGTYHVYVEVKDWVYYSTRSANITVNVSDAEVPNIITETDDNLSIYVNTTKYFTARNSTDNSNITEHPLLFNWTILKLNDTNTSQVDYEVFNTSFISNPDFNFTFNTTGRFKVVVYARDASGNVANKTAAEVIVSLPPKTPPSVNITKFEISDKNVKEDDEVTLTVTLENTGPGVAEKVNVTFSYKIDVQDPVVIGTGTATNIAANSSATVSVKWKVSEKGTTIVTASISYCEPPNLAQASTKSLSIEVAKNNINYYILLGIAVFLVFLIIIYVIFKKRTTGEGDMEDWEEEEEDVEEEEDEDKENDEEEEEEPEEDEAEEKEEEGEERGKEEEDEEEEREEEVKPQVQKKDVVKKEIKKPLQKKK
ncbi:MAG: carboxypeptidase regulatory-like domain-containing protein [Thermoplasmata archaeon]